MPGFDDRQPSDADRPPASRVGDELQARADEGADAADVDRIEREALDDATAKGWDKEQTHQR